MSEVNSFLETLKQLGPARIGVMGAVLLGLLVFFVFMSLRVSTPEMKLLYGDLSSMDSAAIAAKLQASDLRYDVSPDGTRVMVPEDEVGKARMLLAEAGLPNGGSLGYEIFDQQSGFGTTNFVQNLNQVRALEGELARTISSLESVRSARVHLVLPQRELFSRDSRPASASVFVGVRPGAVLDPEQVVSIQSLASSAVPGLKAENVAVIDQHGNLLARNGLDDDALMSGKAEEQRRNYENRIKQQIEELVASTVGYGKVRASVTAELNFDRISTNEELYDPNGQVVRSTQTNEESLVEREPPPKDVSVQNNLPGVGGDLLVDPKPSQESNKVEEVTNYEISKTIRSTVRETGEVKKMSVAVLVDGRYTKDAEGNKTYEPRPKEELDRITSLVQHAIGFDESRGDTVTVENMQFAEIETEEETGDAEMLFGFNKSDLLDAAEVLTVAVMIILVVLLVLQPMVGRLLSTEPAGTDDAFEAELLAGRAASPALTGPGDDDFKPPPVEEEDTMINMQRVEGKVKASAVRKVEDLVASYPTETVSVLRSWMTQES